WVFTFLSAIPILVYYYQVCFFYNDHGDDHWVWIYVLCILVVIPMVFILIFNSIIFVFVRSSTRRIRQAKIATTIPGSATLSQQHTRDVHLLKHILFLFVVFILGWGPLYIIVILPDYILAALPSWLPLPLQVPPAISCMVQIADLFIYNREIRQYLKQQIYHCLHLA
ncbi:unnamed protein product, partial [Adineta ricciae]